MACVYTFSGLAACLVVAYTSTVDGGGRTRARVYDLRGRTLHVGCGLVALRCVRAASLYIPGFCTPPGVASGIRIRAASG